MTENSTGPILIGWIALGAIRVLLGSDTSAIAYVFFGLFWLVSAILLIAALRQLAMSSSNERRFESICISAVVVALFAQGLLGDGEAILPALLIFLVSACVLVYIYVRRLWRGHIAHPSR